MTQKKKKKATTREILVGGGVVALFSPLIFLALYGAGVGAVLLTILLLSGTPLPTLGLAVLVFGTLFAIMLFVLAKFSIRFRLLLQRLIGIFRERRRYQTDSDVFTAETDPDDDILLHHTANQQGSGKHTEYR